MRETKKVHTIILTGLLNSCFWIGGKHGCYPSLFAAPTYKTKCSCLCFKFSLCILWGHNQNQCGSFSRNIRIYLAVTWFWMLIFENDVNALTLWVTWAESGVLAVAPHINADRRWSLRFPEVSGLDLSPWDLRSLHVQTPWTSTCFDRVERGQIL